MESILIAVQEQTSPAAVNEGFKPLSNGFVSHASDLFSAYTDDSQDNTKLTVIKGMSVLSPAEFSEECKKAQKLADEVDSASGFVAIDAAKKMEERYGLKRRVLNQRLSEAKRLYGVFKQAPDVLKEKGYAAALLAARAWLASNKKTWDGNTALDSEARQAKRDKAEMVNAIAAGLADGQAPETAIAAAESVVFEKAVSALFNKLVKAEDGSTLFQVALRIIEATEVSSINDAITYLSEAKMLIESDTAAE